MKKRKSTWLAIAVASVAIIVIAAFFVFGVVETQRAENYWWQQDPGIVRVSDRFKNVDQRNSDRVKEGILLFSVIKIGASSREVEALLGKPLFIQNYPEDPGNTHWIYLIYGGGSRQIILTISNQGVVIDKVGA